jgi:hypothetical protein
MEDTMIQHFNHPTRGRMKVSEVDRMWNAIGDRLRASERREEALADLIAKLSAQRDRKKATFTDLRKASQ